MAIKFGGLIRHFNFKIKIYANVRYEKYPEDAPIEVINRHIPFELINKLTKLELNDVDVVTRLDHEIRRREMQ